MLLSVAGTAVLFKVQEKRVLRAPCFRTVTQRQKAQSDIPAVLRLMDSEIGSGSP